MENEQQPVEEQQPIAADSAHDDGAAEAAAPSSPPPSEHEERQREGEDGNKTEDAAPSSSQRTDDEEQQPTEAVAEEGQLQSAQSENPQEEVAPPPQQQQQEEQDEENKPVEASNDEVKSGGPPPDEVQDAPQPQEESPEEGEAAADAHAAEAEEKPAPAEEETATSQAQDGAGGEQQQHQEEAPLEPEEEEMPVEPEEEEEEMPAPAMDVVRSDAFLPLLAANDSALYELDLTGKHVTAATVALIADTLPLNSRARILRLGSNGLADADIAPLLVAFQRNTGVVSLDLSGNDGVTDASGQAVVDLLIHHSQTLSEVLLDGTSVTAPMREWISFLMSLNRFPRQLKPAAYRAKRNEPEFYLFELTDDPCDEKVYNEISTRIIVDALRDNDTVRTVKLDKCCRGEHCVAELVELLATNKYITKISLRYNQLGRYAAKMLAEALVRAGDESPLEEINLSCNEIDDEGCEAFIALLKQNSVLRNVIVQRNDAISPAVLDRLHTGTALNCEPSFLKPMLPRLLASEEGLEVLDMSGREGTKRGPAKGYFTNLGAATIAESLRYNTVVHTLDLHNNHIGAEGARAIGEILNVNSNITSVDLSTNPLFDEGVRHLLNALRKNDVLVYLNLEGTGCTQPLADEVAVLCDINRQPAPLKDYLSERVAVPEALDFSLRSSTETRRGKMNIINLQSMAYVCTIIERNKQVTALDLSDCQVGDEGVEMLFPLLVKPRTRINRLVLSNTGITDATVNGLSDLMPSNYNLSVIILTGNPSLTMKPMERLDDVLSLNKYPPSVKDIVPMLQRDVEGVVEVAFDGKPPIGDDTCRIICAALMSNSRVQRVSFCGQKLSNRGCVYISELLSASSAITALDISRNEIGPDGIVELAQALEHNSSLKHLDLSKNRILETGGTTLYKAMMMSNRVIETLKADECGILPSTTERLKAVVTFNSQPVEFRHHVLERVSSHTRVHYEGCLATGYLANNSVEALFLAMKTQRQAVSEISLPRNHIDDDGLEPLFDMLQAYQAITSVCLAGNSFTAAAVEPICGFLKRNNHISVFDISGCEGLSEADVAEVQTMVDLNAEHPRFRSVYWALFQRLSAVPANPLTSIDCAGAGMTRSSLRLLKQMFERFGLADSVASLKLIDFSVNSIDDEALAEFVSDVVPVSFVRQLQGLVLSRNELHVRGAQLMRDYAWASASLCVCSLDGNPCIAEGEAGDAEASTAVESIALKLSENRKVHGEDQAVQHLIQTLESKKRRLTLAQRAADNHLAVIETVRVDRDSEEALMQEALEDQPKRAPYIRGMYASSPIKPACRNF